MSNINNNLEYIVEKAKKPALFVEQCEERYNRIIENIAKKVASDSKIDCERLHEEAPERGISHCRNEGKLFHAI
jgi:hypothetical protein